MEKREKKCSNKSWRKFLRYFGSRVQYITALFYNFCFNLGLADSRKSLHYFRSQRNKKSERKDAIYIYAIFFIISAFMDREKGKKKTKTKILQRLNLNASFQIPCIRKYLFFFFSVFCLRILSVEFGRFSSGREDQTFYY